MPLIIPANTLSGDYEIDNSLRFNNDDTAYLDFTPSGAGNKKTWTWSGWVKLGHFDSSNNRTLFSSRQDSSNSFEIKFDNNDKIQVRGYVGGSKTLELNTTQLFRDVAAWYHVVYALDTSNGTAGNRQHLYINGSEVTSFGTETTPDQNDEFEINEAQEHQIGSENGGNLFDGYMADVYFIDGTQKAASDFGETNDNGVWIPKKYTGSYGTNGWKLEFKQTGTSADASGIGADTSGNTNHFAVSNLAAIDITTDTPTNNFNTLNPLANQMGGTLSEGNTKCVAAAAADKHVFGTFGLTKGKWYWEVKATDQGARGSVWVSDSDHNDVIGTNYAGHTFHSGGSVTSGTSNSNVGSGASDNDIICFAADLDNGQMWMSKNEDIDTSGTANITGLATTGLNRDYRISQRETGNPASTFEHNYGNPPFSISSGNADANGYGNFEYEVPTNYYALCTKNLAEFG